MKSTLQLGVVSTLILAIPSIIHAKTMCCRPTLSPHAFPMKDGFEYKNMDILPNLCSHKVTSPLVSPIDYQCTEQYTVQDRHLSMMYIEKHPIIKNKRIDAYFCLVNENAQIQQGKLVDPAQFERFKMIDHLSGNPALEGWNDISLHVKHAFGQAEGKL